MNQNNKIFHDFRGQFPSLPMKKMTMPNLLISMAFLVALELLGGPWGDGWVICYPRRMSG